MTPEAVQRKLAALLCADAVGYSRLMAGDEVATLKALNAHRDAMGGLIRQHGGRVVDAVGDNLLAEFPSVVDAVACALAVQQELGTRNADLPAERKMQFRIGIHLGDVMVEGERIYGDGVNIAARLEALAEPGGVCVSGTVHEQVRDKLSEQYEDLGEHALKNIAHPVRVYRALRTHDDRRDEAAKLTVPGFGGRPAIAVLAFDNLSRDPEQEYFADGIAEDLITRLSAFRQFPVIARNSSFTYKGKPVDVKRLRQELGVRYVVEGSVRKAGDRVRVSAQLIDATTGHHIWAERYDRELRDVFALQDEIIEMIVGSVEMTLERVERDRAIRQPPQNLDAWDCVQRASWHLYRFTKEDSLQGQSLLRKAIELDPTFSSAFGMLAFSHINELIYQWTDSPLQSAAECIRAAEASIALGEGDANAHASLGWARAFSGQYDQAIAAAERAVRLNPSFPYAYALMSFALAQSERPEEAIGLIEKAIRLSPHDPGMHTLMYTLALANFVAGRYEEAVVQAKRSLRLRADYPPVYRTLAASYGHLGRSEEARAALDEMYRLVPNFSAETLRLYLAPSIVERYLEGWRKAGWRE